MVNQSSESRQTQAFSNAHETVLPEHYRLVEMVGRGGMAEVFLGEDTRLGRKVAIKFLNAEFRRDPDRVRRFRQEARSASALNHPNILTIHDIGDHNGVQFIVSEFVEGETLGTRIAQGRLSLAETIEIAMQIASALSASHAAGIVHRDIKPDNVMIRRDGVVKVLDFGLAKARGFTTSNGADFDAMTLDSGSTSPGLIVGTPQYMSPEQARGKELDGRTDIFSLGILIFEMVTRNSPFDTGSFADTMAAILTKEPKRLEEFIDDPPVRLVDLVSKCLKKDRDQRFSSMAEIVRELKLLKGEEVPNSVITGEVSVIDTGQTQTVPTHRHSIRSFLSSGIRERTPVTAIILVTAALLIGGWWTWDRVSFRSSAPSLMRTVPITSWSSSPSELVTSASFSPDGRLVAFSVRKGDSTEIWVKPVTGGDAVQVTKDGGYNQYPIWSPNGQEIVFYSRRGDSPALWKIPFTGGNLTKIVGGIDRTSRPMLWSDDGKIYFQAKRNLLRQHIGQEQPEQLTNFAESGIMAGTIQISDDQKKVAYSRKDENGWSIRIRNLKTGEEQTVATSNDQIDYIAWHPDNERIFASLSVEGLLQVVEAVSDKPVIQRTNGNLNFLIHDVKEDDSVLYGSLSETSDLWKLDTEAGTESILSNEVAIEIFPDVARNGSIAFQSGSYVERPDIASVHVAEPGKSGSTTTATNGFLPTWSNNGEWVAFLVKNSGGYELWRARPDGIDLARISSTPVLPPVFVMAPYMTASVGQIAWSPDDRFIVTTVRVDDKVRVIVFPTFQETPGSLLGSDALHFPEERPVAWTADGKGVISTGSPLGNHNSKDSACEILLTDIESGERRHLLKSKTRLRVLGFAANGTELIFAQPDTTTSTTPTPSTTEIYSLNLKSGKIAKLREIAFAYFHNIHLSRNGEVLGFVTNNDGLTRVITTRFDTGSERIHLSINDPKILISNLGMSADGNLIVFGKQTRTNQLSMLTN